MLGWCLRDREKRGFGFCDQYQILESKIDFEWLEIEKCSGGVSGIERREDLVFVINTRYSNQKLTLSS